MTTTNKAVALGFFDGVHLGHRAVIKAAPEPAVFTFKKAFKDNNINTGSTKHKLLRSCGAKQIYAYDFNDIKDLSPDEFVEEFLIGMMNVKVVCCGFDFKFGKGAKADAGDLARICNKAGIKTIIVPAVEIDNAPVSSTRIRELIAAGDIKVANRLLGYELFYELKVVGGNMQGRTIGFPTINQDMPKKLVLPRYGVYKSCVYIEDKIYDGITNIGVKPTAGNYKNPTAETHIINFNNDLYGRKIKIALVDFIREEKKFNSFDELKNQINEDLKWLKK